MTERLFEQDSYCRQFAARVAECRPAEDGYAVRLDRTAFFPEAGGQFADTGFLDGVAVTDVQITEGDVWHYVASALPVGKAVTGEIDWEQRFSRMQKHTAEHIVSGLIFRTYGLQNVGFHLGHEDVTLDLDGELTREQLDHIEDAANRAVWDDRAVTVTFPREDELATMTYRSKKELFGAVRIVTVEGIDACACCAPHVARTGEIGSIKLLDAIRYKGGVRIHMQAGRDALADYRRRYAQTVAAAGLLSVKTDELAPAVERLLSQRDALSRALQEAQTALALAPIAVLTADNAPAVWFAADAPGDTLRQMALALAAKRGGRAAVFCGEDAAGYRYAVAGGDELKAFARKMNEMLSGRGGGDDLLCQGRLAATRSAIEAFFGNTP